MLPRAFFKQASLYAKPTYHILCGCLIVAARKRCVEVSKALPITYSNTGFRKMWAHSSSDAAAIPSVLASVRAASAPCQIFPPTDSGLASAAEMLKSGQCVAFPTETVYGLGANALDEAAVLNIFKFKGRPLTDPLIVHVATVEAAKRLLDIPLETQKVIDVLGAAFWPGPLTIVAKAASTIPMKVTANTGYVGVRIPNHPVALSLLSHCGLPVAAPSANRFGHVSPTKAVHVYDDLGQHSIGIIDGEYSRSEATTCGVGIESTVLKVEADGADKVICTVYRRGGVSIAKVEEVLHAAGFAGVEIHFLTLHKEKHADEDAAEVGAAAPGMLLTHYAADIPTLMVTRVQDVSCIPSGADVERLALDNAVIIDFGGSMAQFQRKCLQYTDLSPSKDVSTARAKLFEALRAAEHATGAKMLLLADPSSVSLADMPTTFDGSTISAEHLKDHVAALRDRMYRAASGCTAALYMDAEQVAHLQRTREMT